MQVGDLVTRNIAGWEDLYTHELSEIGIVTKIEVAQSTTWPGNCHIIVLWSNIGMSWEDPAQLLIICAEAKTHAKKES